MPNQPINPGSLFPSLEHGFSQVVVARGSKTISISGQTAWDVDEKIIGRTLAEQATKAFANVAVAIEAAGGTMRDVASLRIYVVDSARRDTGAVSEALRLVFPADPPTSTWIGVSFLASPDLLLEIEATAVID